MHCVGGDAARLMVVVVCPCVVGLRCPGAVQSFLVLRRRARTCLRPLHSLHSLPSIQFHSQFTFCVAINVLESERNLTDL